MAKKIDCRVDRPLFTKEEKHAAWCFLGKVLFPMMIQVPGLIFLLHHISGVSNDQADIFVNVTFHLCRCLSLVSSIVYLGVILCSICVLYDSQTPTREPPHKEMYFYLICRFADFFYMFVSLPIFATLNTLLALSTSLPKWIVVSYLCMSAGPAFFYSFIRERGAYAQQLS